LRGVGKLHLFPVSEHFIKDQPNIEVAPVDDQVDRTIESGNIGGFIEWSRNENVPVREIWRLSEDRSRIRIVVCRLPVSKIDALFELLSSSRSRQQQTILAFAPRTQIQPCLVARIGKCTDVPPLIRAHHFVIDTIGD
jgi:hypothetical protein